MIEVELEINAPRYQVWSYFTECNNWQDWWGAHLTKVEPKWETGATLFWKSGDQSELGRVQEEQIVELKGRWLQTTFSFSASMSGSTILNVTASPRGGANFSDGGAAHKKQMESELKKLKTKIESMPRQLFPVKPEINYGTDYTRINNAATGSAQNQTAMKKDADNLRESAFKQQIPQSESKSLLSAKPMILSSKGRSVVFPMKCIVCCGDANMTKKRIESTTVNTPGYKPEQYSLEFEVPYCKKHGELAQKISKEEMKLLLWGIPTAIPSVLPFAWYMLNLLGGLHGNQTISPGEVVSVIIFAVFSIGWGFMMFGLYKKKNQRIKASYPEIQLLPSSKLSTDGLEINLHTNSQNINGMQVSSIREVEFSFFNHEYARLFASMNGKQIIVRQT